MNPNIIADLIKKEKTFIEENPQIHQPINLLYNYIKNLPRIDEKPQSSLSKQYLINFLYEKLC